MTDERRDAFEEIEMHDGARVVHRDKKVSRGMAALLAVPGVFTIALAVFVGLFNESSDKPLPASALPLVMAAMIALGALFMLLAIMFAVLRTVVTEEAVHVRYGLWGPTIPLRSIVSCNVVDYEWTEYGGWGIRRGKRGWAYVPSSGPVVEIVYREDGQEKHVLVGGENAQATVREIERVRAASQARVRVAPGESVQQPDRDLADEEREADEPDTEARRAR